MAEKAKEMSTAELLRFQDEGGELHFETQTMRLEKIDQLIDKLGAMVEASDRRSDADSKRYQSMLEILATMQKMVRTGGKTPRIDMKPLENVLMTLNERNNSPRFAITYEFTFGRSQQGFVDKIRAEPVEIKELA